MYDTVSFANEAAEVAVLGVAMFIEIILVVVAIFKNSKWYSVLSLPAGMVVTVFFAVRLFMVVDGSLEPAMIQLLGLGVGLVWVCFDWMVLLTRSRR